MNPSNAFRVGVVLNLLHIAQVSIQARAGGYEFQLLEEPEDDRTSNFLFKNFSRSLGKEI